MATEPASKGGQVGKAKFALLVPANNPSPDLCKLATSAIALGYPSPTLLIGVKILVKVVAEAGAHTLQRLVVPWSIWTR